MVELLWALLSDSDEPDVEVRECHMAAWTMRKYKRHAGRKMQASQLIGSIALKQPKLFVHWHQSSVGAFA
jgi:hypothetical protein